MTEGHFENHFDTQKILNKYELDDNTFDMLNITDFRNFRFSTIFWYLWNWIFMFLSLILLGVDIYTCLNILVFKNWGQTDDYTPYAYNYAKWIFTGCIIFQFVLLLYHWIWAIKAFKSKNIAYVFVNPIAKLLYIIKSYDYFCLFNDIDPDNFFDSSCFLILDQLDCALQILIADAPRQVINVLTLRYYATDGDKSYDILSNIKELYTHNQKLSVILSFVLLSLVIWSIFFFKFLFAMILYLPIYFKLRSDKGYKSLKKYCCLIINNIVRFNIVNKSNTKRARLDQQYIERKESNFNLLSNSTTQTFAHVSSKKDIYELTNLSNDTFKSYDDSTKGVDVTRHTYRHGSLSSLTETRKQSLANVYDNNRNASLPRYESEDNINKGGRSDMYRNVDNPFNSTLDSFESKERSAPNYSQQESPFKPVGTFKPIQKSSTFDSEYSTSNRTIGSSSQNFVSNISYDPTTSNRRLYRPTASNTRSYDQTTSHIPKTRKAPPLEHAYNRSNPIIGDSEYNPAVTYQATNIYNVNQTSDESSIDLTDSRDPFNNSQTLINSNEYMSSSIAMQSTDQLIRPQETLPYPTRGISMLDDKYDYEKLQKDEDY